MKKPSDRTVVADNINEIVNFLETQCSSHYMFDERGVSLTQKEDKKKVTFLFEDVEKVLPRLDVDGSHFIQVNFKNKTKILITKHLVGFKPIDLVGFDSGKIPKVVTTVDLNSVYKAIEDLVDAEETYKTATELEVLKKVYQSIMLGAEQIGFEMKHEKQWFSSFLLNTNAASA
ncbi:MAG: hypothetical protein ACK41T_12645 [Pseudobdellovibrio sp.]